MKPKIKDIKNYIEGNVNKTLSSLELLNDTIEEQVEYRKTFCKDCEEIGKCVYCGCNYPGRLYSTPSCNYGERFPDLMNKEEWNEYKENKRREETKS